MRVFAQITGALAITAVAAMAATISPPPPTPAGTTVDIVQGTSVADPYRRLEDWSDPKVQAWSTAQNERTRAYLDALPMHSRKFTAALQAATSSEDPILLRTNMKAGHGIGSSLADRIAEQADMLCFLFDQLGMEWHKSS